jgi:hypothetical protein
LIRELNWVLGTSSLGILARDDHADVDEILRRLEQYFVTNYDFLDLLRRVQDTARPVSDDVELMRTHWTGWALAHELSEAQQAQRMASALERVYPWLFRLARLASRLRARLAPPNSRRRRLASWVRRAVPSLLSRLLRPSKVGTR